MTHIDFPLSFDARGRTARIADDAHVRLLIEQLLLTAPGERVMRPDFGSGLRQLLFGGSDPAIAVAVELGLQGSLNQWMGTLIEAERVSVVADDATLRITIGYVLKSSGERSELLIERPLA